MEKSKERLEVLNRINEFEKEKKFDIDVENDLPAKPLEANEVDYLNKKLASKINTKIANYIARKFIDKLIKNEDMIIKEVLGLDNLSNLDTGFIITCNHFNPYDNFALHEVLKTYLKKTKKRFYKVIKEGNYSFKGLYGYFFRHCNTLPLSSNYNTMKNFNHAIDTILKRGDIVLIYPEQAMWWNYRKPRPLKPVHLGMLQKLMSPLFLVSLQCLIVQIMIKMVSKYKNILLIFLNQFFLILL